jgi:hypothetical protein
MDWNFAVQLVGSASSIQQLEPNADAKTGPLAFCAGRRRIGSIHAINNKIKKKNQF